MVMGKKHDRNDRDILLINGRGELLNLYSLDSLPGIYIGEWSHGSRNLWNDNLDERMFAGGFLVDAVTWEPYVTMKGFTATVSTWTQWSDLMCGMTGHSAAPIPIP